MKQNKVKSGKEKQEIVPKKKEARQLELGEKRGLKNGEGVKLEKKTKVKEEEERETHLKASLKNRDARKPNASLRNLPTSSQSKHDMCPPTHSVSTSP